MQVRSGLNENLQAVLELCCDPSGNLRYYNFRRVGAEKIKGKSFERGDSRRHSIYAKERAFFHAP